MEELAPRVPEHGSQGCMKPLQGAADGRNKCQSARTSAVSDGGRKKRTKPFHLPDKQLERLCSQPSLLLAEQRVKARKFTSVLVTTKTAFTSFRHTLSYSRKPGLPPPAPGPVQRLCLIADCSFFQRAHDRHRHKL